MNEGINSDCFWCHLNAPVIRKALVISADILYRKDLFYENEAAFLFWTCKEGLRSIIICFFGVYKTVWRTSALEAEIF